MKVTEYGDLPGSSQRAILGQDGWALNPSKEMEHLTGIKYRRCQGA